jgi:hypothetical protein
MFLYVGVRALSAIDASQLRAPFRLKTSLSRNNGVSPALVCPGKEVTLAQRYWIALTVVAVVAVIVCVATWVIFVDRDEPPGATGSIAGAPPQGNPVTPETPGR